MKKEQFLEALGHLSWCNRCCTEGEYMNRFISYGIDEYGWGRGYSTVLAMDTYKTIAERGIVYAYQQYINAPEYLDAMAHAFNICGEL